jgi:hypothetical protein
MHCPSCSFIVISDQCYFPNFIYNGIKLSKLWIAKNFDIWNGQNNCTRLNETYLKTTLSFPLTIYMDKCTWYCAFSCYFLKKCIEIIIILNNRYLNYNITCIQNWLAWSHKLNPYTYIHTYIHGHIWTSWNH